MQQTVASDLRRVRTERGLSQAELAARISVSRQTINAIENGRYAPATELALKLASVLHCRVEDMFRLRDAEGEVIDCVPDQPLAAGARVILGRVGEQIVAHGVSGTRIAPDMLAPADGHATDRGVSLLIPRARVEGSVLLAGCDPTLAILAEFVASRATGQRVVPLHSPSESALRELADGLVHVAGSHLPGSGGRESNVADARRALARGGGRVVTYASWEQGIVVAPGNPRGIREIADLGRPDVRIVNRDRGSGARRFLDDRLQAAGIDPTIIAGYDTVAPTHISVARGVQAGVADAGIALAAVAYALRLDFVPLGEVRFDLVIPAAHMEHPGVCLMLDVLQSRAFRADLAALPGYDVSRTGSTLLELKAA
jgi:molybdate-binding protein/DNA-binding XRE family transcriptional regulator